MKQYNVISERSIERLIDETNQLINDGWELCGGISVIPLNGGGTAFYQAIKK